VKFKIDENLPIDIAKLLRAASHDAVTVTEQGLIGEDDRRIIDLCLAEERALVTLDLDFSDVRSYPPEQYAGIVVLRVRSQDKKHVLTVFSTALSLFDHEQLSQRLWIVGETQIRIRGE
jgi:predicted nuclease of predicted toxin-antitoxin system